MTNSTDSTDSSLKRRLHASEPIDRKRQKSEKLDKHKMQAIIQGVKDDDAFKQLDLDNAKWEALVKAILKRTEEKSTAFTAVKPLIKEIFVDSAKEMDFPEPDPAAKPESIFYKAADELRESKAWKSILNFVLVHNRMSCPTAINNILLAALDLATEMLAADKTLDEELATRFDVDLGETSGTKSWLLLHQDVIVPSTPVANVSLHGILEYTILPVSGKLARLYLGSDQRVGFLEFPEDALKCAVNIVEAKQVDAFGTHDMEAQVLAKGATLCVTSSRPAVITVLTDGTCWCFFVISKRADKNDKPFMARKTPVYHIFRPNHLAIVLRLLSLAILKPASEFSQLIHT
ncbi:hypothetical protein FB45DRAFT_997234, partial [Roridomyces roridus]